MSTPETVAAELERLVRDEQRKQRLPSVTAAVVRDGELVWETAVGTADVKARRDATADTQYRVGSITKTFTAAAIMQLRDEGKLDLEDTLDRHVEGAAHAPTIRRLLSHTSGLQRETHDDAWLHARFADVPELLETFDRAEQVLRLLEPLGLVRTTFEPRQPAATGYLVQPYVDGVWDEAPVETGAWIAAGQMWGTVRDLCRWATFLADPDEAVLKKQTVEEMRTVQSIDDHVRWTGGYGLGLMLRRDGERVLAGHGGSMPGFIAGVYVSPAERIGAAALTNSSTAVLGDLTLKLVAVTNERWPVPPEPWQVEQPPPDDVVPLLGIWFMEGSQLVISWRDGTLEARFPEDADWKPPAVFRREAEDRWRIVSGWEHGEVLRVEPDRLVLSGYPVTREPQLWV